MQANDRPLYIFDLDGTMALIEHRRPLVEAPYVLVGDAGSVHTIHDAKHPRKFKTIGSMVYQQDPTFKPNWSAFYEACHMDMPNASVIKTFNQLYTIGAELLIWSEREDSVREKTVLWLSRHTGIITHMIEQMLKMRPAGDYTPDEQLKRKWLNAMNKHQRARLTACFDDRQKVVDMYRGEGVSAFQVAPGDF
jgi:hypothetical protein